jgi:hypothetical protein
MKRFNPFGVGRLMRAAICGLLAATVIPAAASADLGVGGVTVTTPSTPVPAPTVTVSASASTSPSVSVSTTPSVSGSTSVSGDVSSPVASASVSSATQATTSKVKATSSKTSKTRKKSQRKPKRGAALVGGVVRTLADSTTNTTTSTGPFTGGLPNNCIPEFVTFTDATVTTSTQFQSDGTLRFYLSYRGTGVGTSGATYSFSEEQHGFTLGGAPQQSDEYFYDYQKLIRRNETTGALGGDDSYLRVAFRVINLVVVPDMTRSFFECR